MKYYSLGILSFLGLMVTLCPVFGIAQVISLPEKKPPANPSCTPAVEWQAILDEIDPFDERCRMSDPCWKQKLDTTWKLLKKHPDDVLLNRAYQEFAAYESRKDDKLEERTLSYYKNLVVKNPNSAVYHYLYSRATDDDEEAQRSIDRSLELDPEFPWSHLGRSQREMRKKPKERNDDLAKLDYSVFVDLCPSQIYIAARTLPVPLQDFARSKLSALRAALPKASPRERMKTYRVFWQHEFRLTKPEQHDALRQSMRTDLDDLATMNLADDPGWWRIRIEGLKLVVDTEGRKRVESELATRMPCDELVVRQTLEEFDNRYSPPDPEASTVVKKAYARARYDATNEWITRCPNTFDYWQLRLIAIRDLPDLPKKSVLKDLDRTLELWEGTKAFISMPESPYLDAARILLKYRMQLDRVTGLIEKELALVETKAKEREKNPPPENLKAIITASNALIRARIQLTLGEAQLALGKLAEARTNLDGIERELADLTSMIAKAPSFSDARKRIAVDYYGLRADLAERAGSPIDAFAYLRRASVLVPQDRAMIERAKTLWLKMGGSEGGWGEMMATNVANESPTEGSAVNEATPTEWEVLDTALKPFEIQDITGRMWTPADLRGKVTLINFWGVTCAPCRAEMPLLQELHTMLASRQDRLVLTMNVDRDMGAISPFLKEKGYTFPTLLANTYSLDIFRDGFAIPINWIVDSNGIVRFKQFGFSVDKRNTFVAAIIDLMDKAANITPPSKQ